jgi:hypothetical protein
MRFVGNQCGLTKANYSEESFLAATISADPDAPAGMAESVYARESVLRFAKSTTDLVTTLPDSDGTGSTQSVVVNRAFVNQLLGGAKCRRAPGALRRRGFGRGWRDRWGGRCRAGPGRPR